MTGKVARVQVQNLVEKRAMHFIVLVMGSYNIHLFGKALPLYTQSLTIVHGTFGSCTLSYHLGSRLIKAFEFLYKPMLSRCQDTQTPFRHTTP